MLHCASCYSAGEKESTETIRYSTCLPKSRMVEYQCRSTRSLSPSRFRGLPAPYPMQAIILHEHWKQQQKPNQFHISKATVDNILYEVSISRFNQLENSAVLSGMEMSTLDMSFLMVGHKKQSADYFQPGLKKLSTVSSR